MANIVKEDGIHVDETTKFDIGDHYRREGSSLRILMEVVKDVTNRAIICSRGWETHCRQLDKLYGDAQHTIYAVTKAIVAWCQAIIGLVADELNWKWKNEMIRKVDKAGGKILLEIKAWLLNSSKIPFIPDVEKIKAPTELLLRPPYYLSIQTTSQTCIIVQSSHSPSLEFLAKYLRKNCRRSRKHIFAPKNKFKTLGPPVMDIKLDQNPFTPKGSAIYDTLTLKAGVLPGGPVNRISPLILVRLVENELGYEMDSSDQNSWYFRRQETLEEPPEEPPEELLEAVYR